MRDARIPGLFITGTDTEVGKTVVTAGIAFGLRRRGIRVGVMKPVATGCARVNGTLTSLDAEQLLRASGSKDPLDLVCPYRFEPPVAPWVATENRYDVPRGPSVRRTVMGTVIERAFRELARRHDVVLVEGIGGLLVPLNARESVADLARRLGLPVLVVARAGLGTINHTLLTLEAARTAGLEVVGVVLNGREPRPSLAEQTNPRVVRELGKVPVFGVIPRLASPSPAKIASYLERGGLLNQLLPRPAPHSLADAPGMSRPQIRRLSRIDRKRIWHPFTQMADWEKEDPLILESGQGVFLTDVSGRRYLDGVSSLWVNLHGHRHPALDRALLRQAGRVAHSTLLGAANVPAIELAEELIRIAPKNLTRVFYSDNGSTAVEVALKMAFQFWQQNGQPRHRRFVHFVNAYHGDTLGAVSVGGIDLFHRVYGPLLFRGFKVPAPYTYRCPVKRPCSPCDLSCLEPFEQVMRRRHNEIAGVVVEPLVQGAAGMITQPAGWLKRVERICRRYGVFLIADEVAVGFGRTGRMFACEHENVRPDFLCVAKGLSGGYLPLAATLTTEKVYRGFLGSVASLRTFFHGHSYTGNPLACAVALENLRLFRREKILRKLQPKIRLFEKELDRFRHLEHVGDVRQKGLIAGIELVKDKKTHEPYPWGARIGIQVCRALRERGILLRPLGNVIVLMPPLAISQAEISFLCREARQGIETVTTRCYTARDTC